ncbi:Uma2 family endonuclease [Chamaesiphon polymorphus]|jgi:Uma2 family endonuclease|uniref:Uma2 family endonuclease n=1 Tax=Chamaesiphon polymorphus CCALA 037 TaxID=2107692 RepID=A0A2T1G806_9CYAN|nr:Uma2 family endonuclease [Chamaesiphon polymorphus]PSB53382.1 Uma2 family endonuclease [Chamaesiphon polymorphus CCALA 037]
MIQLQEKLTTNTWIKAEWDTYVSTIESPKHEQHQGYYYNGYMRIEDMPIGADHASDNGLIYLAVTLFCMVKGIPIQGLIGCSYRKTEVRECQPDISFYIGDRANLVPKGKSVVNLDEQAIPNLVIEISNTTINDDLGAKRFLYEEMGVSEYWIVDVQNTLIYAFEIIDRGSRRIDTSLVLPALSIETITEALNRSKESDQAQVGQWLMSQFQG